MGDREARYGVSFGLSDPGGSLGRAAEHLTLDQSLYGWGMLEDGGRTREYAGACNFDA